MSRRDAVNRPFGVLLVDKPAGPTSHDVVGWVRWGLRVREVGHCGTLDPAATGLLVLCVGGATRLVSHLSRDHKHYEAVFSLGVGTDTLDAQGQCVTRAAVDAATHARAVTAVEALVGTHMLPPPRYSAVKVQGVRAHEAARKGIDLALAPRAMAVLSVDEVSMHTHGGPWGMLPSVSATLAVRKGTYIRSLAELLGAQVQVPCHLASLRRVGAGRATLRPADTGWEVLAPTASRAAAADDGPATRRPPPWRLSLGCAREALEARLRSAIRPPWPLVSFPSVVASSDASRGEFARLAQGQRLSGASSLAGMIHASRGGAESATPNGAASADGEDNSREDAPHVVVRPARDTGDVAAILVRVGEGGRIEPARVVRR